jgi:anti-sigma regulatory factor (Ser/Thr protein kinase)
MRELSMHIMDIVENSISAGATLIEILIRQSIDRDLLEIEVIDNGKGMDKDFLEKVFDPFVTTRTTRKVGLGIPLFKAAAERCDGSFDIQSEPGKGTRVKASFRYSHIDRAPMGDLVNTITALVAGNEQTDFVYHHITDKGEYVLDTREIKKILGDVSINNIKVIEWMRTNIEEGLKLIDGGGE